MTGRPAGSDDKTARTMANARRDALRFLGSCAAAGAVLGAAVAAARGAR